MPVKQRKMIGIAVGVMLACAPMAAFHYWIDTIVARQGAEDVNAAAHRAIWLAESRIKRTVATLEELSQKPLELCSPDAIKAFRQRTFASTAIKEISVVGPDGITLCSDMGASLEKRTII